VGAAVWYSVVAEHVEMAVHWRSLVVVSATDSHWSSAHTVCDRHVRSEVSVGALVSYSSPSHTVLSWHTRFDVSVLAVRSHCVLKSQVASAEQTRLCHVPGAVLSYCAALLHTVSATHGCVTSPEW
jgi:hypothetical protein